MISCYGCLVYL